MWNRGTYLYHTKYLSALVLLKGTRAQRQSTESKDIFCDKAGKRLLLLGTIEI